jgi:hypothetical protein
MNKTSSDRATKVERLLQQVVQVYGVMVDQGMMRIQDNPQLTKIAQEGLPALDLIFKHEKPGGQFLDLIVMSH